MSRSGYSEDYDYDSGGAPPEFYWQALDNAMRGKRGQALLRDIAAGMDAMEHKVLVKGFLRDGGAFCMVGVATNVRNVNLEDIPDGELFEQDAGYWITKLARRLNVAQCVIASLIWQNDEFGAPNESPAGRWRRIRSWIDVEITR
jgi:hypothetical protein